MNAFLGIFVGAILLSAFVSFAVVYPHRSEPRRFQTYATVAGMCLALSHLALIWWTWANQSRVEQSAFIWIPLIVVDLPLVIFFDYLIPFWSGTLDGLVFGVFGTLWWFFLPFLFLPRRWGGMWGRKRRFPFKERAVNQS